MDAVERPRAEPKRFDILTDDQARIFTAAIEGHPLEAMFYLAITTSMRKGEILGASVTTDIYGHAMARSQQEAARMIEKIVTPRKNE